MIWDFDHCLIDWVMDAWEGRGFAFVFDRKLISSSPVEEIVFVLYG